MVVVLVHLLCLISIASSAVISKGSSREECPVWFKGNENGSCECGSELGGIIQCDPYKQVVSIMVGYCMSVDNSSQELLVGFNNDRCLSRGLKSHQEELDHIYNRLPTDSAELEVLCTEKNEKGLLCGECREKYGPSFNSLHIKCIECKTFSAILIFLFVILLITVFYIIVVIFRLNITSGAMLGYTIFCQAFIAGTRSNVALFYSFHARLSSFSSFVLHASIGVSAMWWYFATIFYVFPHTCFSKNMTSLQVILMEYIFVLYPLFLLIVTYVCIELHARNFRLVVYLWKPFHKYFVKVRKNWRTSDSIIHAYATFSFLSFIILTYSCFNLLYTTNVYNINGTVTTRVLVYEPTMETFSPQHLPYAITAIILLFLLGFCPTLFLCLYSTRLFTRCFRLSPRMYLQLHTFADTFQCCYKDGLNGTYDFRFFSPVPMVLSLSIILAAIYSHNTEFDLSYMLLFSAVFLGLSFVIAYVKPYKSGYMNFSLSFHSAIIGFGICIIILWMDGRTISTHLVAEVITFLAALPHLFALMTAVYYILNRFNFTRALIQLSLKRISSICCCGHKNDTREPLPDRLENSASYRTIPDI